MHECPCCRYLTISEKPPGTFEICPVCNWEDDNVQFEGGANSMSLEEARKNYREFGATSKEFLTEVREPLDSEKP